MPQCLRLDIGEDFWGFWLKGDGRMKQLLLVIDMQNDFIDGVLGSKEAMSIVPRVKEKIENFCGKVLFTRDTHMENYMETQEGKKLPMPHCMKYTKGWEIHPELEVFRKEEAIDKPTFGSDVLALRMKKENKEEKIDRITLIGVCTDICVISNAMLLKTFLPETEIVVDASCCAGVTPESHKTALQAMKACQIVIENER